MRSICVSYIVKKKNNPEIHCKQPVLGRHHKKKKKMMMIFQIYFFPMAETALKACWTENIGKLRTENCGPKNESTLIVEQNIRSTYISQLIDCICFDGKIFLFQLLFYFINTFRYVFALEKKKRKIKHYSKLADNLLP